MSSFLLSRRPKDPREMVQQIMARFPTDHEKALRVFTAVAYEEPRYVRACIEHAFETWSTQTPR